MFNEWLKITDDPWVLETITGYRIVFNEQPFQDKIPNEIPFNKEEWSIVDQEVQELLRKGAIVPCEKVSSFQRVQTWKNKL